MNYKKIKIKDILDITPEKLTAKIDSKEGLSYGELETLTRRALEKANTRRNTALATSIKNNAYLSMAYQEMSKETVLNKRKSGWDKFETPMLKIKKGGEDYVLPKEIVENYLKRPDDKGNYTLDYSYGYANYVFELDPNLQKEDKYDINYLRHMFSVAQRFLNAKTSTYTGGQELLTKIKQRVKEKGKVNLSKEKIDDFFRLLNKYKGSTERYIPPQSEEVWEIVYQEMETSFSDEEILNNVEEILRNNYIQKQQLDEDLLNLEGKARGFSFGSKDL